jgi:hypothetical protein
MADNPTMVAGVVLDSAGGPVAEARVFFTSGPVPLPDIVALTDGDGRFALSAPVPGTYDIEVAADLPGGPARKSVSIEVQRPLEIRL